MKSDPQSFWFSFKDSTALKDLYHPLCCSSKGFICSTFAVDCHVLICTGTRFLCFFCSSDKVALLWFMFRATDVIFFQLMLGVVKGIREFKTQ